MSSQHFISSGSLPLPPFTPSSLELSSSFLGGDVLSWSRREVVPYPVLPMTLIQVTNGDFSIHIEIDTSAYLSILISWWAGGILEGVQDFDGCRSLFLLDVAIYVPKLSCNPRVGARGTSSKQGAVGTLNPFKS